MIQLVIMSTAKGLQSKEPFAVMGKQTYTFEDKDAARAFLKETYCKAKRSPMFRDSKPGDPPRLVGYVYRFRNADYSHAPVEHWSQEDWVEFQEITPTRPTNVPGKITRTK